MSPRLFRCGHFTVSDRGGTYPIVLEPLGRRVSTSQHCYASLGALKRSVEEDEGVCECLMAWAQSDACWACGDGTPVEAYEGKPFCEKCALTMREGGCLDVEADARDESANVFALRASLGAVRGAEDKPAALRAARKAAGR